MHSSSLSASVAGAAAAAVTSPSAIPSYQLNTPLDPQKVIAERDSAMRKMMNRIEQAKHIAKKLKEKQKKRELKEQAKRALQDTPQEDPMIAAIRREAARQRAADEGSGGSSSESDSEASRRTKKRNRAAGKAKAKGRPVGAFGGSGSDSDDYDVGDSGYRNHTHDHDPDSDYHGHGGMNPGGWDTAGAAADVDDDYDYFSETDIRPHLPLVVPRGACEPLNLHAPRPHTTGGHFIPGEFVRRADTKMQRRRDAKTYGGVGKPELRTDGEGAPALEIEPRPVISGSAPNVRSPESQVEALKSALEYNHRESCVFRPSIAALGRKFCSDGHVLDTVASAVSRS
eukprot:gene10914-24367_t